VLSDDTFGPLDLDAALEGAEAAGDDAVIALLDKALTGPRAGGDRRIADLPGHAVRRVQRGWASARGDRNPEPVRRPGKELRGCLVGMVADLHALDEPGA